MINCDTKLIAIPKMEQKVISRVDFTRPPFRFFMKNLSKIVFGFKAIVH